MSPKPIAGVCDFCNNPNTTHLIPVPVFGYIDLAALFGNSSPTEWAACDPCWALFITRDKDGLLQRAIEAAKRYGARPETLRFIAPLHSEFWKTLEESV